MVRITMLAGPYARQVIEAPFGEITPQDVLCTISGFRHPWTVDYSEATDEEKDLWENQEISMRVVRELASGATVSFLGKKYRSGSIKGAFEIVSEIEQLLNPGQILVVVFENKKRLVLKAI